MASTEPRKCSTCIFYQSTMRECRKNPPQVIATGSFTVIPKTKWPTVVATQWCGEWRRKL